MKGNLLASLLLIATALAGCMTGKQLLKLKSQAQGTIDVSGVKHVNEADTYTEISGTFGFMVSDYPTINLGIRGSYQPIKVGEFKFSAVQEFFPMKDLKIYTAANSSVPKSKFVLAYEYPLTKKMATKETTVGLYGRNVGSSAYYTIMDVDYLDVIALRIGGGYSMSAFKTETYATSLKSQYNELRFQDAFEKGEMKVIQGSYLAKLGLSYSRFFGTTFEASSAVHNFVGSRFSKLSFYGDIQALIATQTSDIDFSFFYFDSSASTFVSVNQMVNPSSFLTKKYVGFALGMDYTVWYEPFYNLAVGAFVEIGATPGYFDRIGQGIYGQCGIHVGFGRVK